MIINDVPLTIPFRIKDINSGHYIFSILDKNDSGDLPFDIAFLPVIGVMIDKTSGMMEVETELN